MLPLVVNLLNYFGDELAEISPIVDVVAGRVGGELGVVGTLTLTLPPPTASPGEGEPVLTGLHPVYMPAIVQES